MPVISWIAIGIAVAMVVTSVVVGTISSKRPSATATPNNLPKTTAAGLATCVLEGFGGSGDPKLATSWYGNIKGYSVSGSRVDVDTNLFFKDENKPVAMNIRGAVISCAERSTNWVTVHAGNSGVLASGAIPGR